MKDDIFETLRKQALTAEHFERYERATFKLDYGQWSKLINAIQNIKKDDALMEIVHEIERQAMGLPSLPLQKEEQITPTSITRSNKGKSGNTGNTQ